MDRLSIIKKKEVEFSLNQMGRFTREFLNRINLLMGGIPMEIFTKEILKTIFYKQKEKSLQRTLFYKGVLIEEF